MSNPDAFPPAAADPRDGGATATAADWAAVCRILGETRACSPATRRRFGAALQAVVRRRTGTVVAWPDVLWLATAAEAEEALDRADPRRGARPDKAADAAARGTGPDAAGRGHR